MEIHPQFKTTWKRAIAIPGLVVGVAIIVGFVCLLGTAFWKMGVDAVAFFAAKGAWVFMKQAVIIIIGVAIILGCFGYVMWSFEVYD